jgi:alpha-glucosidase (family GH31 glycosyl hydrolase)
MIGSQLLAAPILYPKKTARTVYLPGCNWYDLHTGAIYAKGSHVINNVSLVSKVPMFIPEGSLIMMQNTTSVRQTKYLNNRFILRSGMYFDGNKSNESQKVYTGNGSILSIKDLNDDVKITQCLSQGCEYFFKIILTVSSTSSQLEINCTYKGLSGLNEELVIYRV